MYILGGLLKKKKGCQGAFYVKEKSSKIRKWLYLIPGWVLFHSAKELNKNKYVHNRGQPLYVSTPLVQ